MQNICKLPRNQRNKLQVAHFLEFGKNMSKHSGNTSAPTDDGLMLSGYQKKLKTMKKKFFVLYKDTQHNTARLEYYDNERKFKSGLPPKRVIRLRNCFSINRRLDTKHDFVIALSTKDGGFGIVLDTEEEMLRWLEILISLQRANLNLTEHHLRPQYEHVWQVYVQRKGLAELKGITGNYHVCLTPKTLTFVRIGADKTSDGSMRLEHVEFQLTTIRRCGDSQCFFYMEVGRQSVVGPGELWMETEDALTAQNMHQMILSAMSTKIDFTNMGPMQRKRSSSANEASKPINVLQIKQTYVDNKYNNSPRTSSLMFGRERCDSLPTRNRTSSESSNHSFTLPTGLLLGGNNLRNSSLSGGMRTHSYQRHSNSPPVSSAGFGCSESEESSISIDETDDNGVGGGGGGGMPYWFNTISSDGVIPEENTDEIGGSDSSAKYTDLSSQVDVATMAENYVNMSPVIAKSQQAMSSEQQHVANICSPSHGSPRWDPNFSECAVDHAAKVISPDEELPMERPTRAYSIGSRSEHNRMFKQHMGGGGFNGGNGGGGGGGGGGTNSNDMEHNNLRVRAFSVGSRAKIPRCDLQRNILTPKLLHEQQLREKHCHSNSSSNYNISADVGLLSSSVTSTNVYNLRQLYTHRDKKSTSAPLLLLHKSQNSVDRMGDLMEIDFSIKQNSNSTNSRINLISSNNTTPTITTTTTISNITKTTNTATTIAPITATTTAAAEPTSNKTYNSRSVPSAIVTDTTTLSSDTITTSTPTINIAATTNSSNNSKYSSISNNALRKYNTITTTSFIKQQQQPSQQQQQITATDNGYLEMKPVGSSQPIVPIVPIATTTNMKQQQMNQQQQQQQQRSEQLQKQTPKTLLFSSTLNTATTTIPTTTNIGSNEQIDGYDVPPEKLIRQPQQNNLNINANFTTTTSILAATTTTTTTVTTTNTVLENTNQDKLVKNINADNDNNHNNLEIIILNDDNLMKQQNQKTSLTTIISTPEKKTDLILDMEVQKQQILQQQQECKLNKNIVNDDYASMERKFDTYMTLTPNPNSNNYNNSTTTTTITSPKLHDNDKHNILTHSLSHDEQHNKILQQKLNRKSCGSSTLQQQQNVHDAGYEMLQIRNDKTLLNQQQRAFTSAGNINAAVISNKDNNNKIVLPTTTTTTTTTNTIRPRSTNSTLLQHSLSTTSNNSSSNASLSQPVTPTPSPPTTTTIPIITTNTTTVAASTTAAATTTITISNPILTNSCNNVSAQNAKVTPPPTSRPSSVNLEQHELYYAKLDWAQCSQEAFLKAPITKTANSVESSAILVGGGGGIGTGSGGVTGTGETVVLPSSTNVHNVYAKIDFDHSDSSSSSSKNI